MQETLIKKTIRKEKHNKGITLIALVVTIIILLILAGVSIITLTGENGIITRTSGSKTAIENASVREQVQLAVMAGMSNRDLRVEQEMLEDALTKSFGAKGTGYTIEGNSTDGWTVTVGTQSYKITSTGGMEEVQPPVEISTLVNGPKVEKTTAVKDTSTTSQTFYIPQDFKLATGSPTTVDEGIVIEDESGNQFVWVPVPDVIQEIDSTTGNPIAPTWNSTNPKESYTPMASIYTYANSSLAGDSKYSTLYRGLLYTFSGTTATYQSGYNVGTTNYREPSLVTGDSGVKWAPMAIASNQTDVAGSNYDRANYANAGSFATASAFGTQMQKDYNDMIASVATYGGFYVGRFETGYVVDNNVKIAKSKPASTTVTTADATASKGNTWYGLYKMQKEFATSGKVRSSMIWGSQYDAMMNWMAKTGKTVGTADSNKYNTAQTTGSNSADILNNVFDLYGCHREWTLEAYYTSYRAYRGGDYYYSCAPALRNNTFPTVTNNDVGSRLTLYIVE